MSVNAFPLLRAAVLDFASENDYEAWIGGRKREEVCIQSRGKNTILKIRAKGVHVEISTVDDVWERIQPPDFNAPWRESIAPWLKTILVSEIMED